jgi:adenine-specific DNA-methyltransferase
MGSEAGVRKGTLVLVAGQGALPSIAPLPTSPVNGGGVASPSPFTGRAGEGDAGTRRVSVPIELLGPGDRVLGHDGQPHEVARRVTREYCGAVVCLCHDTCDHPLWLAGDQLVPCRPRPRTLGGSQDWSGSPQSSRERRRALRAEPTIAEALLWQELRGRGCGAKFRRQHPIGPYIADFYSREAHLVVEVDGDTHLEAAAVAYDLERDAYMGSLGVRVLRFTDRQVREDLEAVARAIGVECTAHGDASCSMRAAHLLPGDLVFAGPTVAPVELREAECAWTEEMLHGLEVDGSHSFLTDVCAVHDCSAAGLSDCSDAEEPPSQPPP